MQGMIRSVVKGVGGYLPETVVTNRDLTKVLETTDEWIQSRTGIRERRFASPEQRTSDLAFKAAQIALTRAAIKADQVDLIIVATTTPDHIFPSTATIVQEKLQAKKAFAFDIQAVCSGFIYALSVADNFIKSGQVRTAVVIGAEVMSRILDPQDRATYVLFGDGAGAVVLQASAENSGGILSTHLFSDGAYKDLLYVDGGAGQSKQTGYLKMIGREVFRHAVGKLGQAVEVAMQENNLNATDINWFVPHQANTRIIQGVCEHFGIPQERVVLTIDHHANTSAASIPLALNEAVEEGKIKPGHLIVCEAMGGGFTWGSAVIRW
jgi:3-oxoacyl-[acyl-carrier-protein] synthase III